MRLQSEKSYIDFLEDIGDNSMNSLWKCTFRDVCVKRSLMELLHPLGVFCPIYYN